VSNIEQLSPTQAYEALQANPDAILLDVRDPVEYSFVGHPVGAVNIPFKIAPSMASNPDFLKQVQALGSGPDVHIYLLCRSGQRSMAAAELLAQAGYRHLTNIEEGFEGAIDADRHRSTLNGWRFHNLPWQQS
jgi:rhodanese-related sulfurtransferase